MKSLLHRLKRGEEPKELGIGDNMNEREFYSEYIRPQLTDDKPRNRMIYNDVKDMFHRDGRITDKQVRSWCYPTNKFFVAKEQRRTMRIQEKKRRKR